MDLTGWAHAGGLGACRGRWGLPAVRTNCRGCWRRWAGAAGWGWWGERGGGGEGGVGGGGGAGAGGGGMVLARGECLPLASTLPLLPVAEALGELSRLEGGRLLAAALDAAPEYVRAEVGRLVPGADPGGEGVPRGWGWPRGRGGEVGRGARGG